MSRWERFWFENGVLRVRLATFRVAFFGPLAFDMWMLMFVHAPRYGAGGFNVAHFPWLDALLPVPSAALSGAIYLVGGFLAFRVALGAVTRLSLYLLTAIYGLVYFWSQADSYQHHYLIALLLLLSCFLPLEGLPGVDGEPEELMGPDGAPEVKSWAARLIYVEVSIVYFFTAVTKTSGDWLNGWALNRIIHTDFMREFLSWMGGVTGTGELGGYAITGWTIMLWQFFVATAFLFPKLRPLACITGPMFHILVEVIDLKIGWFSYYMIALYYILLFPDRWFLALARPVGALLQPLRPIATWLRTPGPTDPTTAWMAAAAVGMVSGAAVWQWLPAAGGTSIALVVGLLAGAAVAPWPRPAPHGYGRALAQLLGVAAMLVSLHGSGALYDYHRFWGGDLKRRGELESAAAHYESANRLAPEGEPARFRALGGIYERLGRRDDARVAYEEAARRRPDDKAVRAALSRLR